MTKKRKSVEQMSAFEQIKAGLEDAIAYRNGDKSRGRIVVRGKTTDVPTPKIKPVSVQNVRLKTGRSQKAFAKSIGITIGTLRNWEQGRSTPKGAAAVLINLIDKDPKLIERELSA